MFLILSVRSAWILPEQPVASYWTTSLVGSTLLFLFGAGNSILAPPAIFLIDGPNENAPPIGVTVLSSYYSVTLPYDSRPPKLPLYVRVLDVVGSFIFLPFAVVVSREISLFAIIMMYLNLNSLLSCFSGSGGVHGFSLITTSGGLR